MKYPVSISKFNMELKLKKKVKNLFSNSKIYRFRSVILTVGTDAKEKIPYLYHMWSKNFTEIPSILWCHSTNNSDKKAKKKTQMVFDLADIRYCYYTEINKIIGNTFGMCILENFEKLTPSILAKIIETIKGGGVIIFLLNTINKLDKIYSISMDIYRKFESECYRKISGRFVERFIFSLNSCPTFLIIDKNCDKNVDKNFKTLFQKIHKKTVYFRKVFLLLLKNIKKMKPLNNLVEKTKTFDQARALLTLIEALCDKLTFTTVLLTSARGRGKSSVLGLATSAAIAYGYGNIYITTSNPESLNTYFAFTLIGLKILNYEENKHFQVFQDSKLKFIKKIKIFCTHLQTVNFAFPSELEIFKKNIELLIIDEAASLPVAILESICGFFSIFISTTIFGYEGSNHYFTLKFMKKMKLKLQNRNFLEKNIHIIQEIKMNEPIRYSIHDPVEKWLNEFLCLNTSTSFVLANSCPDPRYCKLFLVDRNILFSCHKLAVRFLQKIFNLLISIHYKNSPDDLQMLCDAPSHRILVLINPLSYSTGVTPDLLGILHISYEGQVSQKFVQKVIVKSKKISGDLIPWAVSKEFLDSSFSELSGLRIIRIVTHPDVQNMGYGFKMIKSIIFFFQSNFKAKMIKFPYLVALDKTSLAGITPMLISLQNRTPFRINYIGVSYDITHNLFRFWKKNKFKTIFIRNQNTKQHNCVMLYPILNKKTSISNWIRNYQFDFLKKFLNTISWNFNKLNSNLIFSIIQNIQFENLYQVKILVKSKKIFSNSDIYKILFYVENHLFEYRIISELFFQIIKIAIWNVFLNKKFLISEIFLLISMGLQHKKPIDFIKEFNYKPNNIIIVSKQILKKFTHMYIK